MDRTLVLLRHGQSEWNALNLFTGFKDVTLTHKGTLEARRAGQIMKETGLKFDCVFTSALIRAQATASLALEELDQTNLETQKYKALNERDYGELTGLNKDEARKKFGDEQVHIWRRSYDIPPPGGESLKDTAARVLPCYLTKILPLIMCGQTILVAAHGNSLRALIMVLEGLDEVSILQREIATGAPLVYKLGDDTRPIDVKILL